MPVTWQSEWPQHCNIKVRSYLQVILAAPQFPLVAMSSDSRVIAHTQGGLGINIQHTTSFFSLKASIPPSPPPNKVIPTHNLWEYTIFRHQNFSIWSAQNILYLVLPQFG